MSDFTYSFFLPKIMIYSLFLYKYQVQNTLPPRRVYDTSDIFHMYGESTYWIGYSLTHTGCTGHALG